MQRYLEQLIDDLHKATWGMKPPNEIWQESEADPDDELEDMFHFHLDFPEDFPAHLRYQFILDFWEEEHVALSFGEDHVEFCNYSEGFCAFPDYCTSCPEIKAQLKYDEEHASPVNFEFDEKSFLPTPAEIEAWKKEQGIDDDDGELDDIFGPSENYDPADDFAGGFFNDDGTPFDPESVPVPGLCKVCRSYYAEDPEEKFLCMMNRNDQRDDPDFICGVFEKL